MTSRTAVRSPDDLAQRLAEAEATIQALMSGQIDAVVDSTSRTPVLLAKAQEALRESEERYRQIVEVTTDGIITIDRGARIVFANRRFAEMLGYEPGELISTSVFDLMLPAERTVAAEAFRAHGWGIHDAVDGILRHKNGTEILVHIAGTPLVDAHGRPVGHLGIVRDVTERKKLQAQLMVSDRMASVGTLAAGVAHEINNPLAAVIANIEYVLESLVRPPDGGTVAAGVLALDPDVRDEIKAPLDDALEAAQRVRFIVRDLKIFSRAPLEEAKGPVDVEAIMESSLRMAWNEIRHRAHVVKRFARVQAVEASEARLGQVFLNLLVNAAQALPEGRSSENEIGVTIRPDGECVVVEVSDTGSGILPENLGRVFDAFFTTKAVGVGTGLGLAICHRIVTDMGGTLTVESRAGAGTTFRLMLPIAGDLECPVVGPVPPAASSGRRGRVLVVDDEQLVRQTVTRVLAKEHDVVAVSTVSEALALCGDGARFDLILCDLMMPDKTGMDLHRELVRSSPAQANRMVFLTGGVFTDRARRFLAETPTEQVEKPFDAVNLRAIVRRYVH